MNSKIKGFNISYLYINFKLGFEINIFYFNTFLGNKLQLFILQTTDWVVSFGGVASDKGISIEQIPWALLRKWLL